MDIRKRSAEEIRKDVIANLSWDSSLDDTDVHVDVVNSIVTLTGTVPTYGNLSAAEHDARVIPGVSFVDNRLDVSAGVSPAINDDELRDRVRHVIEWNPAIDASRIDITVKDRLATLSGKVETFWQKSRARSLAAEVSGVDEVVDGLEVEPPEGVTDEDIDEAMDETISRLNLEIGAADVSVHGGFVTLTGAVGDYRTYRTVEQVAGQTSGVVDVSNELKIG